MMGNQNILKRVKSKLSRIRDYIYDNLIYYGLNDERKASVLHRIVLKSLVRGRKIIGFYGECHIYVYGGYLSQIELVKQKYCLLGKKEIEYLARWHTKEIAKKSAWDKLDVLIYNPGVPNRNGAPSLEQVLEWIPDKCKKIEVTNAAFKGYMPQHTEHVFKNNGYFVWGDKYLNKLLDNEIVTENNYAELSREDYISEDKVNEHFDKSIKWMKMYERQCTIKIADYIEKNGKDRILYYSVTHPETELMIEITRRILKEIGVDSEDLTSKLSYAGELFDLHSHGESVYPCVIKGLGIQNSTDRRVQYGNYKEIRLDFKEYIREYIRLGKEAAI